MAGGGDVSGCVEFSATYCTFYRFNSGKYGIRFDCTGDTQEAIWAKDPTCDVTKAVLYLDYLDLHCTSGAVRIVEGSGTTHGDGTIAYLPGFDMSGAMGAGLTWDFEDDPLRCLTAESTESLCLSSGDGWLWGFMKVHWGE